MELQNPDSSSTYYRALGGRTDKTLLLLHGIGADHTMWQSQIDAFVAAGFHVLMPDLFGHGRSSNLSSAEISAWHRQINWLLDHHSVTTCTLIGVSMGGVIAQSFVVNHPQRVEKLIVADTFGELSTLREKALGVSAIAGLYLFKVLGKKTMAKTIQATYTAPYASAAQAYFGKASEAVDLNQLLLARKAINRVDILKQLQDVTIPALVIVGEDFGEAFIEINRKIATALPNSQFVILKRAMDPSNLVNPVEFNQHVLDFLTTRRLLRPQPSVLQPENHPFFTLLLNGDLLLKFICRSS
ncbi:MAG: alpha/beta hydrolase, partial [Cyanobacteria bacterium J06553_1]